MKTPEYEILTGIFRVTDCSRFLTVLRQVADAHGTRVICFNADLLAGRAHAEAAVARALRAEREGTLISSSFEMEALLFASGDRQCSNAARFGVHEGLNRAYVCFSPPSPEAREALTALMDLGEEDWEELAPEKVALLCEAFGITPRELDVTGRARLRELVLERVALLEVYR